MQPSFFSQFPSALRRRLGYAVAAIFTAITFGATGFYFIEGFSLLDSFYLATETVTTVGYGDLAPKSTAGRVFAIFFMLVGGTVLYALTVLVQSIVQAEVFSIFEKQRKMKEMSKLSGRFIVCGAGRVGRRIIRSLENLLLAFPVR